MLTKNSAVVGLHFHYAALNGKSVVQGLAERKKMKRTLIVAALLTAFALTGCGKNDNTSNGGTTSTGSSAPQITTSLSDTERAEEETTVQTGDVDGDGFIEDIVTEAGDIVNDAVTGAEDVVDDIL